ncbi:tetratricopeptide repeat protein [Aquimarina sp. MMG016]|uniref:tetratricopeptide repeat-containing sensor histidine kinase n=1 Tax=Aquimarina sp. MMG016 TaxID=2822690 RepID=UPI001B3A7223|nr:tetratricopeptide repeat protein [Aquimarina sp. MMG016]MBQ4819606.1 tetratricopeptide repeat protein [Aquimarina sp. MMG016]
MTKLIFSFLFFLIFVSSYTQKVDSLYLSNLSKKIISLKKSEKLDSAINQSHLLLINARSINNQYFELNAYNKLAAYYRKINSPFESAKYYTKSKELNLSLGDTTKVIEKLRHIASIQKKLGDLNSSENTSIYALLLSESLPDSINDKHKLGIYNHLGITTNRQKNYVDAIKWYKKALELTKDTLKSLGIRNNIALASIKQGNYNISINDLHKILEYPVIEKKPKLKARVMDNLAFAKSKLSYPKAEEELIAVLELRKEFNDLAGQFASNIHLTEHYQDRKQYKKALTYANNAYEIANKLRSPKSKIEALSYLIKLKDNPKLEAIEFERLNDSTNVARQQAKNQFVKIKYETDQYREENLRVKAKNAEQETSLQRQKNQRIILLSLISLLCIGVVFIVYYLKQRSRIERIKERHSTEKRLSKKLHDEVGNDVFYLMSQLQNETDLPQNLDDTSIVNGLNAVYHKVRDFSRDHTIETGSEYGDELLSLLNSYGNQNVKIFTNKLEGDFWTMVSAYKKVELYWVLKELLTNMKKHSQATLVSISISKEQKNIIIKYTDNGIGADLDIAKKHMNGLRNVENRITEMKGTITFETKPQKGFKSIMKFAP